MGSSYDEGSSIRLTCASSDDFIGRIDVGGLLGLCVDYPEAFVRIDPRQNKVPVLNWHGDHDRPIFFVELRERYVCSWCEMHDGRLILILSHESKCRAQHVRYPAEATIVGRVTGVTMDLVEPSENEARA